MKNSFYALLTACIMWAGIAKANKTFWFAYDNNGNRTTLTFSSTCRVKNPKDTTSTPKDSTVIPDQEVLSQLQSVISPKVYPTLVRTDFLVSFPTNIENGTLNIYDMNGNVLYTETGIYTANTIVKVCDMPAGMYNVVIRYGKDETFTQKIIKQ